MSDGDLFDNLPEPEEKPHRRSSPYPAPVPPAEEPVTAPETAAEETLPEEPSPPEPPAPEPEDALPPPEPLPRRMPLPRAGSLGQTLAELRRSNHLEIADVADETRIKSCYIEALENDAFSELPHMVYVLAYVKKLCSLYGVYGGDAEELLSGIREQLAYEIPEDIDKSVICREQDEDTRRKLRQISIALIAGAALIVLLLVIGGTTLILRSRGGGRRSENAEEQLSGDWLMRNLPPQQLKTTRIALEPKKETPRKPQRGGRGNR